MGSPLVAPPEARDVTLALFGGPKLDVAPSDVPEGLSLDTQDGIYLPGDWQSRPGLARLFAANGPNSLPAGTSVLYEKTYMQPNDDPLTLILTSDGKMWVEDVGNTPGILTNYMSVPAGLYAQSVTEFGREYIAFSDLLHGQGVPLQFDGTSFDRVTMDGPAGLVTAADTFQTGTPNGSGYNLGAAGIGGTILSATEVGNICTITTTLAHGFTPGMNAFVVGCVVAGYNGFQTVLAVSSPTVFTYVNTAAGLGAAGVGGNVYANILHFSTTGPLAVTPKIGDAIVISGATPGAGGFNPNNAVAGNPAFWILVGVNVTGTFFQAVVSSSTQTPTNDVIATGGTINFGGQSSPGVHQVVVMFLTRQGYLTKPSPASRFNSAGNQQYQVTNLPIGPSNVVARVLGFTGAGGDNFFIIPATITLPNPSNPLGTPIVIQSTVVPDNTSTSAVVDFSDTALFGAVAIDQVGNDLFDQVVLGPVLGFFAFASRLCAWGDFSKIENFLNLGFCGGVLSGSPTIPLGWNTGGNAGGTLFNGGAWGAGKSWQITGDGTASARGLISQSAYQDSFGDAILQPNTAYMARVWGKASAPGLLGSFEVKFSSVSTGYQSTSFFSNSQFSTTGGFLGPFAFAFLTPATIPADMILSIFTSGLDNGATVAVTEIEIITGTDPYRDNESRWSYVINPEAFALTTGNLGPDDDASPIRSFALLRQTAVLGTAEGIHSFSDTTAEPDEWSVNQVTRSVGLLSVKSFDAGKFGTGDSAEDWLPIASHNGVYIYAGAQPFKISQEISRGPKPQSQDPRKTWDDINFAAQQTVVAKNDPSTRRMYFSVPLNGALTPNTVFVIDYRELETAAQIASAAPMHITLSGKMRSSDLTRKWSTWNVFANDLEILIRPGNARSLFFASAPNASATSFNNIYSLSPTKLTDDDYGAIGGANGPYYTTYFFTDHEQEAQLGLGADRKLVKSIHAYITGVGMVTITPLVNSLYNFMPALSPRLLSADIDQATYLNSDLEWTTANLRGQRIAFRISVQPLPGTTDVQICLQKFIVAMMRDPVSPFRQSGV